MNKGSITTPAGFRASGVSCGIKGDDQLDLALIACECPATVAGVFTTNRIKGHSLQWTLEKIVSRKKASALIVNSGNANACVGKQGAADAHEIAELTAKELKVPVDQILLGSTGVIGVPLDMKKIRSGIKSAVKALDDSAEAAHLANQAMLTTDTKTKEIAVDFPISYDHASIGGMAKGSGMIHPNLATMIAVITTDVRITPECLQQALSQTVYNTFNRISADGETSCCDMVVVMSSGLADHPLISDLNSAEGHIFMENLRYVATGLSRMIAADGEGASKLVTVRVCGAANEADAYFGALAVAKSPLAKTAIFGEDANWGRIINALGYSGANFNPAQLDISIGDLLVCHEGMATDFSEKKAKEILQRREVLIQINFNQGYCDDHFWTCDFTDDYIRINADYRS
ncbi:MAG TPA: bifunctional glutamate N-acetyltransferase/amino-acid acetyltransferase ArgJ [Clostridiaceae bacterium]|nr:bifunctional glutamate N-acetyltransferase/amino-acid acetyltransferase ArgJ [Clostridiaceae bacterium]